MSRRPSVQRCGGRLSWPSAKSPGCLAWIPHRAPAPPVAKGQNPPILKREQNPDLPLRHFIVWSNAARRIRKFHSNRDLYLYLSKPRAPVFTFIWDMGSGWPLPTPPTCLGKPSLIESS